MAAKSKKRLSTNENKLLKLEFLQLSDVLCSICQSILIEPVTLPCFHDFCRECFNGSVEYSSLCCPLCRMRIGSWLRTKTKQNNLVNLKLWEFLKARFQDEVSRKLSGEDLELPAEKPKLRLSAPGEIRVEYENELKRLKDERLLLEQKHSYETESLIKKIQEEEQKAHREYLDRLTEDERLAKELAAPNKAIKNSSNVAVKEKQKGFKNGKLKTIDSFLIRKGLPEDKKPPLTESTTPVVNQSLITENTIEERNGMMQQQASPELVPSYGKFLKNYLDRKLKNMSGTLSSKENNSAPGCSKTEPSEVVKAAARRLSAGTESSSVDSVRQELCYFKPIKATVPSQSSNVAVRVLAVRGTPRGEVRAHAPACATPWLRRNPDAPSAFVCLSKPIKTERSDCEKMTSKKTAVIKPLISDSNKYKLRPKVRKSSSTGSLNRLEETPKKYEKTNRKRKAASDGKKPKITASPASFMCTPAKKINRRTTANKNLLNFEDNNNMPSPEKDEYFDISPLKINPDIIAQQKELEKRIEQERKDLELARALQEDMLGPSHRKRIKM